MQTIEQSKEMAKLAEQTRDYVTDSTAAEHREIETAARPWILNRSQV